MSTSDGRWTPSEGFTDIRCDEDYEAFYRAQLEAGRKLPPPLDNRTLYETLPQHVQHGLTKQQQRLLAARMTPSPNGEQHVRSHPVLLQLKSRGCGTWLLYVPGLLLIVDYWPGAGLDPINEQRVSPNPADLSTLMSHLGEQPYNEQAEAISHPPHCN